MGSFENFFKNLKVELSEEYIASSTKMAIIFGIVIAAFMICTAFFMGKNKGLGIVAGIFQCAGVICAQKMTHIFANLEFFKTITAENGEQLDSKVFEYLVESLADLLPYSLCSMVIMAGWIMSLVFIIKSMQQSPKVLPVFALILHIARYLIVSPVPMMNALSGPITEEVVKNNDMFNYIAVLVPMVLIFIPALIGFIKSKKAPKIEGDLN